MGDLNYNCLTRAGPSLAALIAVTIAVACTEVRPGNTTANLPVTGLILKPANFAAVSLSICSCALADVVQIPTTTSQFVAVVEIVVVVVVDSAGNVV